MEEKNNINTTENEEQTNINGESADNEVNNESAEPEETKSEQSAGKTVTKKEYDELYDKYLRSAAEYENYRKRSAKEKENIYSEAVADVLRFLLPVLDNLERAAAYSEPEKVLDGLKLILNQFADSFSKLGVEEIKAVNEEFNPEFHNAVMLEENSDLPDNTISDVLIKGYRRGDKIIRASSVKVTKQN